MTAWSRVTLVGERRRVDAVLPAQEPIGTLLPEVLQLLGDPVSSPAQPLHLTTAAGVVLDGDATLAGRSVPDGSVLRLVRADEPLPAPVVHEVPEAVGDALDGHAGRWTPAAARWTATCAAAVLWLGLGVLLWTGLGGGTAVVAVAAMAVLLGISGAAIGPTWRESLGTALSVSGAVLGCLALWLAADLYGWPGWVRWDALAIVVALLLVALGLTSPLGRGGVVGGGIALLLALLWPVCALLGLDAARVAAVTVVACVVLLSLLLRIALTLSGLTALDDRRSAGATVARTDVLTALVSAHRSMTAAIIAVAVAAAVAGLALAVELDGWTAALSLLFAVVLASRSRFYPLIAEKAALIAASLVVLVSAALAGADQATWAFWTALGLLVAGLAIPVTVLAAEPPEYVRARLRRITSRFEAVAVVALIPVAIGVFGTYERLLNTF
ncbi:type VII secretion integral membrane protein EccD [Marinitenerispora sediminis]|uniref:Type VII secretion integral membrane protein EccD n=1 Tax=Marinitenerispora sediminis TaxID=1931232 RepID=A0A368T059_9ACTN|nr:type VII secretion integral membrane protein EccD [Marinitenerispora sediminis]RCV48335.1 type VII secretion integral membrane protein EccD [Marinitenerispora sediminis]RCV49512.1 type VII secretion integral membrane protein EccD [Marinitenerispora sediminis]RCV52324.1 type VII secretion integral membrane protein EccD [Marinitenerispora sediminis]